MVHRPGRRVFRASIRAPSGRATPIAGASFEQELTTEQQGLDAARRELDEQAARNGGDRNSVRAQPLRDKVQLHERNVEALRREISNLR